MPAASDQRLARAAAPLIRRGLCALMLKDATAILSFTLRERLILEQLRARWQANPHPTVTATEQALIDAAEAIEARLKRGALRKALEQAGAGPQDMRRLQQEFVQQGATAWRRQYHTRPQRPRAEQDAMTAYARSRDWYNGCSKEELAAVIALMDRVKADAITPVDELIAALDAESLALVAPILCLKEPPRPLEWWQLRGIDGVPLTRAEMTDAQHAYVRERSSRRQAALFGGPADPLPAEQTETCEQLVEIVHNEALPGARRPASIHRHRGHRLIRRAHYGYPQVETTTQAAGR